MILTYGNKKVKKGFKDEVKRDQLSTKVRYLSVLWAWHASYLRL